MRRVDRAMTASANERPRRVVNQDHRPLPGEALGERVGDRVLAARAAAHEHQRRPIADCVSAFASASTMFLRQRDDDLVDAIAGRQGGARSCSSMERPPRSRNCLGRPAPRGASPCLLRR
jgi:hypothetical protein